jgi:hypothetical protein
MGISLCFLGGIGNPSGAPACRIRYGPRTLMWIKAAHFAA